jgi:Flp pilus assembly protein TadG
VRNTADNAGLLLSEEILRGYALFEEHEIMRYLSDSRLQKRSGQMIIFVTLSLFVLFSVMGLAVDLGYSYYVKVSAQQAADSAAAAAIKYADTNGSTCGTNITCNSSYTCPRDLGTIDSAFKAGCAYAKQNGYATGVSLIANNNTPPYASGVSASLWIQANVAQTVTHPFLFWAGFQSGSVETQATSAITKVPNSDCIYVLDTSNKSGALSVTGAAILTAQSCGVYVNSSSSSGIYVSGSSQLLTSQSSVVGGYNCSWTICNPTPTTGAAPVADPLSGLTAPTVSGTCTHTNYQLDHVGVATISPDGVYCGGINVIGAAHLTLHSTGQPFILKDGGFTTGNSAIVDADGPVTIFLTAPTSGKSAPVSIGGASVVTLSASSSGTYQGILFYQDGAHPGTTASSVGNSAVLTATGTWYMPNGVLTMSGAIATGKMALVVKDLTVANSATFQQDTTGAYTGLATKSVSLIQ